MNSEIDTIKQRILITQILQLNVNKCNQKYDTAYLQSLLNFHIYTNYTELQMIKPFSNHHQSSTPWPVKEDLLDQHLTQGVHL